MNENEVMKKNKESLAGIEERRTRQDATREKDDTRKVIKIQNKYAILHKT